MRKVLAVISFMFAATLFYRPDFFDGFSFTSFYPIHLLICVLAFMAVNRCFKNAELIRSHKEVKSLKTRSSANRVLGYGWYLAALLTQLGIMAIILTSFYRAGILKPYESGVPLMTIAPGGWLAFSTATLIEFLFITSLVENLTQARKPDEVDNADTPIEYKP